MIKNYNKVLGAMAIALSITACSDKWDEHYNADSGFKGNLWETISSNPELSNFANVLKASGYDASLASSQMFTVFAPTNANLSEDEASDLIADYQQQKGQKVKDNDNTTIKEFIQNHIALYNYSVSSNSKDSIVMMNGKYLPLTSNSFGGQAISGESKTVGNGILYTLDNKVNYTPNVFEYLEKDAQLDSVAKFLYAYNDYQFEPSLSVPGDIVDGKTQYLDSVSVLNNKMFSYLKAKLSSEDSTYWMVVPTNEVWERLVPEYEKYFQYDKSIANRDSMQYVNARLALLRGTVFSRTLNPDASVRDSAMSTNSCIYESRKYVYGTYDAKYYQYDKPYDNGGIFNGTEDYQCSNGKVMKSADWNIDKKQTFFQTIIAEGENNDRLDSVNQKTTSTPLTIRKVNSSNPFYGKISGNSYCEITPSRGAASDLMAVFNVPNVLSNVGYDIYVVIAPATAYEYSTASELLPTKIRVRLSYNDEDGKQPAKENGWTMLASSIETNPEEVCVFKVGDNIKIPYCSVGDNITPQVKIILSTRVTNSEVRNGTHNRIIRLDNIIFKPHEEE